MLHRLIFKNFGRHRRREGVTLTIAFRKRIIVTFTVAYYHAFTECLLHIRTLCLANMASANSRVVSGPFDVMRWSPKTTASSE